MTTEPILIIGAGGHAAVIVDAALSAGHTIIGCTDRDPDLHGTKVLGVPVIGDDDAATEKYGPNDVLLVTGIGSVGNTADRRAAFEHLKAKGYRFAVVRHPNSVIARDVELDEGTVVMAGAVIQPRCRIGANVIINTGAQVDHDGRIGAHCHIAPGAVLSGEVTVGDASHIGTGTVILQGTTVGTDCIVGAGAVIIRNLGDGEKVAGNPAGRLDR